MHVNECVFGRRGGSYKQHKQGAGGNPSSAGQAARAPQVLLPASSSPSPPPHARLRLELGQHRHRLLDQRGHEQLGAQAQVRVGQGEVGDGLRAHARAPAAVAQQQAEIVRDAIQQRLKGGGGRGHKTVRKENTASLLWVAARMPGGGEGAGTAKPRLPFAQPATAAARQSMRRACTEPHMRAGGQLRAGALQHAQAPHEVGQLLGPKLAQHLVRAPYQGRHQLLLHGGGREEARRRPPRRLIGQALNAVQARPALLPVMLSALLLLRPAACPGSPEARNRC